MLPAQRFESFSKTQNIGLASIKDIKNSEVLNTVTNKLKEVTKDLEDRAKSLIQGVLPEGVSTSDIDDQVKEGLRSVKDTFSTLQDMSGFTQADIEGEIAGMLPGDPGLQNAFRTLSTQCRDNAMSKTPGFKPFLDKLGCGTPGSGRCKTGEVNNFFNKMSGGVINTITRSIQSMLKALITLGNLGYSGGLCKIFATIANGMPGNVVQRGAAGLLASVGGAGNIPGVLDIAANMGNAVPSREIPGLVGRISENFKIPSNYNSDSYGSLYEGMNVALESIDPGYDQVDYGLTSRYTSIAPMGKRNTELAMTASSYIQDSFVSDFTSPIMKPGWDKATSYVGSRVSDPFSDFF